MQGLDPDRVAYLGSASKSLAPVLRLGWMVLPDNLIDPVLAAAGGQQFYVNAIDPQADHGRLHRIRSVRQAHSPHAQQLPAPARRALGGLSGLDVAISGLSAGLHALIRLPDGTEHEVMRRAADAGIALSGLALLQHPDAADTPPRTAWW